MSDVSTQIYFCKQDEFLLILQEFKEFDLFVRTRAIRRRAYIRYLETKI
jgi:hypothetical protein